MSSTQVAEGTRTARKTHECVWCEGTIEVGEKYSYWTIVDEFEHTAHTMKTHLDCSFAIDKTMELQGLSFNDELCMGPHDRGKNCIEMECDAPHCHDSCYENWKAAQEEQRAKARCIRCGHTEKEHAGSYCYCACEDNPRLRTVRDDAEGGGRC